MQEQFNFYDIVGYIIPGGLVILLLYWLGTGLFALKVHVGLGDVGTSLLILGGSYVVGHLVQVLGRDAEKREEAKWGGAYQYQYLQRDKTPFTPVFVEQLKVASDEVYGTTFDSGDISKDAQSQREHFFWQCYYLIFQQGVAQTTMTFLGIKGLARGLLVTGYLGIIISSLFLLKCFIPHCLLIYNQDLGLSRLLLSRYWLCDPSLVGLSVAVLLFSVLAIYLLKRLLVRFSKYYAESVYRNFYGWYRTKYKTVGS